MELVDKCAAENGLLVINTHITDGWGGDYTRITDVIARCKEKGYQFMTMGQAWAVRKPVYDWFAMMNG